jgi:hypothetical protein
VLNDGKSRKLIMLKTSEVDRNETLDLIHIHHQVRAFFGWHFLPSARY